MSFQPVSPLQGIAGWRFMQRTQEVQQAAFSQGAVLQREVAYFKEHISKITTAEELVADFTLLKVALGAFGLEDRQADKFFMKKVLSEGTENEDALAIKLTDTRYADLAVAFGFGNAGGAMTGLSDFGQNIAQAYEVRQFEKAVGEGDNAMRLALNLEREIGHYANAAFPDTVAWFELMANPPLKEVFQTAFNLPQEFGLLNIDRQRQILQDANERLVGSSSMDAYKDPENIDKLLRTFFAREQINNGPGPLTPGMSALTLMQNAVTAAISFNQPR